MTCDFSSLAAPGVRTLQPYQPGKPESELRREYGLSHIAKLASNENPLGPSPKAVSYTHLDVYKRQVTVCAKTLATALKSGGCCMALMSPLLPVR